MQESSRSEDSRGKMALSVKLIARQGQSMALTPQLLQAIKLLEMPAAELSAFVENELTSNPLLERAEGRESEEFSAEGFATEPEAPVAPGDWAADELETDRATLESRLGTELENAFESDPAFGAALSNPGDGLSLGFWRGARTGAGDGEPPNLDAYAAEIAERLATTRQQVERVLLRLQALEPTGVFARSLSECLALQLKERDRLDPAMQALLDNLPALAKRDFALLRRACGVDDEDLMDMAAEIRRLEPKPGRAFRS